MPAGDGTGPLGLGPMTGRGMGYCAGFPTPGYANPWPRLGLGRGWGRGFRWQYWATGLPGWVRYGYTPGVTPFYPGMAPEQELNFLKNQASFLEQQLNAISKRIKEIESAKGQ